MHADCGRVASSGSSSPVARNNGVEDNDRVAAGGAATCASTGEARGCRRGARSQRKGSVSAPPATRHRRMRVRLAMRRTLRRAATMGVKLQQVAVGTDAREVAVPTSATRQVGAAECRVDNDPVAKVLCDETARAMGNTHHEAIAVARCGRHTNIKRRWC